VTRVAIRRADLSNLETDIEELLDLIGYTPVKERVLLKPNIVVAASPEDGAITHPKVTEALVHYFRKRKREVVIAEGTGIFGGEQEFERLLRATGYDLIRDQLGVPIINLEQTVTEDVPWRYGYLPLPKLLKRYEYVNVPTMKTHSQTMVSLGVKNQKGLIPMKAKKMFHKKGLHSYILELSNVIRPALTVMDAIYCIEGTGPTGPPVGRVKKMDLVLAGKDMMAVDNVAIQVMGFDIKEIRHLRPIENIHVLGEEIKNVRSEFEKPMATHYGVGPFVVYSDEKSCTMCTVTLYKAFSKIINTPNLCQELSSRKELNKINIVTGTAELPPELDAPALCIGDCSTKVARKMGLPQVKGCHPDYREVVNFLFPGYYSTFGHAGSDTEKGD
jgi:uncharacterized protein (DUF362 family)